MMKPILATTFSRRQALYLAGAGSAALALSSCSGSGVSNSANGVVADCVLTPEKGEGPFYTDTQLVRSDITDGRPGTPLDLELTVIDSETCKPLPNAIVDIWHADANGLYSTFPNQGHSGDIDASADSFLRGAQPTDANGLATFSTIYPGWYPGRTTHVHIKVLFSDQTLVTSQLYFPDDISNSVYTSREAYGENGGKDTTNNDDGGLGAEDGDLRMMLSETADGFLARHTIGIKRA